MTTRFLCPILRCYWYHERPAAPDPMALASVFGVGTIAATGAYAQSADTEQAIAEHLDTHSVLEFVQTISEERQKATAWLVAIDVALTGANGEMPADVGSALTNAREALNWFHAAMFNEGR